MKPLWCMSNWRIVTCFTLGWAVGQTFFMSGQNGSSSENW